MPIHLPPLSRRRFLLSLGATFITLPALKSSAAETDPDLFAILNDTHIGEKQPLDSPVPANLRTTIDWLLALPKRPAAVFINGDLAMRDGQPGDYVRLAVGGLSAGVSLRRGHPHRWLPAEGDRLPAWLEGADVVETFLVDARHADFQMTVTLSRPATLYVFYDFHQPPPSWLRERFTNTGTRLLLERAESDGDVVIMPFTVWKMDVFQAGAVTLGPLQEAGEQTPGGHMYRLAAKALP